MRQEHACSLVGPPSVLCILARSRARCALQKSSGGHASTWPCPCQPLPCQQVGQLTTRASEQGGRQGSFLEIPHCLGRKPREGLDSKGAPAQAWDFVVHPDAVERAAAMPGVMATLVEVVGCRSEGPGLLARRRV